MKNIYTGLQVKYRLFWSDFYEIWIFSTFSEKKILESNFMKIRPVGAEFFHEDRRTGMTKLIIAFRNLTIAPKKKLKKRKTVVVWPCVFKDWK